jgi:hypothetical protein
MPSSTDEKIESLTGGLASSNNTITVPSQQKQADTMATLVVEKEKAKESTYRSLYKTLLGKHEGILIDNKNSDLTTLKDYEEETALLRTAIISERNAWILGITMGIGAFISIRFLPRYYIYRFGGKEKYNKLKEAEALSRQDRSSWLARSAIGALIEGSLSFWIGVRAYQMASQTTEGTYEIIAQVPMVKGRSIVADKLCAEWVQITKRDIPPAFWENLDEGNLQDTRTWTAIRAFSQNCIKRKLYERVVAKELGVNHTGETVSLPNKVPDYIPAATQLTTQQALQLVSDQ